MARQLPDWTRARVLYGSNRLRVNGLDIRNAINSGGKAGKGNNVTSTVQVLRTVGDPKGLHFTQLEKHFRYTVGDTNSLNKAIAKAMAFAEEFAH